ncbi:MAG: 50S ribosomal protein L23 [Bacillota bacterium]|jgi:large subunit ribosomal protein L23|nr:50S ribosomal protein L23 [Bacillota bacterium]MDD3297659.1 50S ribosomal protein L23 [Bacillota bacterium]MDD3850446.1 50S ribosomal protein L23 [Bacillota bacterium]MDD4706641.1 50S ribosomal protein L23 [Bacillota bacterium]
MKAPQDIVVRPVITERSMRDMEQNKYTFVVDKKANKIEIKKAVEELFGVKVERVNVANYMGKMRRMGRNIGRKANWKKAFVKLAEDSKKIEFFEGM